MARNWFSLALIALLIGATAWALSTRPLPPADFTFINESEIKSVDPALIIGQPEMRVVSALFEGLVNWDPKTLAPIPGVAESWELSPDLLTYTFHFRKDAKWSDGSPVTPHDFLWQWRRMLDPLTVSEYSYQLWYLESAQRYSERDLKPGDRVEIELNEPAVGALPFARGKLLHGRLVETLEGKSAKDSLYAIEIDGQKRLFQIVLQRDLQKWSAPSDHREAQPCKNVLLDFDEVGVKALDDRTLQVKLKSPTPYFLFLSGYYPLYGTNPKCVETYG